MELETLRNKFRGVTVVTVTPFDDRGRIDHEGLASHLEFLLERGVEVIFPCGNTSEFYSLTREEVNEATRRTGRPRAELPAFRDGPRAREQYPHPLGTIPGVRIISPVPA